MEVTKENFNDVFPQVKEAIESADFLALDCEFTGLGEDRDTILHYDTPEFFYHCSRKNVDRFLVIQLGLTCFGYITEQDAYWFKSFNFYIFPRPSNLGLKSCHPNYPYFVSQASSLDFLSNQGFDFNKWIVKGVGFMRRAEYESLNRELNKRHQWRIKNAKNVADRRGVHMPDVPDHEKPSLNRALKKVKEFLDDPTTDRLALDGLTRNQRRLLYEIMDAKYGTEIYCETVKETHYARGCDMILHKCNAQVSYDVILARKLEAEKAELDDYRGFCKVVDVIQQSKKLLVGHNILLDILHVINAYCWPLPEDYDEFKNMLREQFTNFLDTKLLASEKPLKAICPDTTLEVIFKAIKEFPFKEVNLVAYDPCNATYIDPSADEKHHDAGYDSFITGRCFISMINYYSDWKNPDRTTCSVELDLLLPFLNKVAVGRIIDLPYLNLRGPDVRPNRSHVFHGKLDSDLFVTSDIIDWFSPFGPIGVHWIDGTSFFVALHKQGQSEAALKAFQSHEQCKLMLADDFLRERHRKIKEATASTTEASGNWRRYNSNHRQRSMGTGHPNKGGPSRRRGGNATNSGSPQQRATNSNHPEPASTVKRQESGDGDTEDVIFEEPMEW